MYKNQSLYKTKKEYILFRDFNFQCYIEVCFDNSKAKNYEL